MNPILRTVLIALLLTSLAGCTSGAEKTGGDAAPPEELVLRSYAVPDGLEERMVNTLSTLMRRGEERVGRAMTGPDGLVLVLAPESVHGGIEDLLQQLAERGVKMGPPETVEVTYWVVLGKPRERDDPEQDRRLLEILIPLETIEASQGSMYFELRERARVSSILGEHGKVSSKLLAISQRVSRSGSGIMGDIDIRTGAAPMRGEATIATRVTLQPDQFLVLGESGWTVQGYTQYYVMRARILDAG